MPISAFLHALRAFQSGRLAYDDLSVEIDRQLTVERTSSSELLEILNVHHSTAPLPGDSHQAIFRHIEGWPQDPTIVTVAGGELHADPFGGAAVGDIVRGRFSLEELIGEGGMSRVFKAVDLRRAEAGAADPHVAVKVLTEPFNEYFGSPASLQREAHKLQSLTHPNIVRVIDCDRDGRTVFMTMEYLPGRSLQKILRSPETPSRDPAAALRLVVTIGEALEYAHRNHIVHGDLKPGNVIVTDAGTVKVIDFGMAKFVAHAELAANHEPHAAAAPKAITPRYASPELAAGSDPEPADDVYALACLAYEVLTGMHPLATESGAGGLGPDFRLPHPPRMPAHQYRAIVRALAFHRRNRTTSVRRFLDELTATERHAAIKRWALLAALSLALLGAALFWTHGRRMQVESARAKVEVATAGAVLRDCATCPLMMVLPPGRFVQGSTGGGADGSRFESPRHIVLIGRSMAMSSNEVTVGEYREFAEATHRQTPGCTTYDGRWQFEQSAGWQAPGFAQSEQHPVTCVSWEDATAYAGWLSAKTGHPYRLPSASEWEYAAQAGTGLAQPWDAATAACGAANVADRSTVQRFPGWAVFPCDDGYVNTAPVGSFKANAFGLNDLLGNVFEWVQDCWHDDYTGAPVDGSAWVDSGCGERELRGGSWFSAPQFVSASYRNRFANDYRSSSIGFRLVREIGR